MGTPTRRRLVSYGTAAVAVAFASLLTLALPQLGERSPLPLFFGAVAVAAWLGGQGPALWATGLSLLALDYLFVPPAYAFALGPDDAVRLAAFVGVALLISALQKSRGRFLTVCAACRRVRERRGVWVRVESYLRQRAGVECSHGLCAECAPKVYPQAFPETAGDADPDGAVNGPGACFRPKPGTNADVARDCPGGGAAYQGPAGGCEPPSKTPTGRVPSFARKSFL